MRVFIYYNIEKLDLEAALRHVSEQRREQVLAFKPLGSRKRSAAAYLLLRHALRVTYGMEELPFFSYGGNGKPFIKNCPNIHFNLSHCREAVVCAVDDHEVGVDVESIDRYNDSVARYVSSDDEMKAITDSSDPASSFITLWTKKEATLKLTGEGINDDIKNAIRQDVYYSTTILSDYGCIYTVASFHPIGDIMAEVVEKFF